MTRFFSVVLTGVQTLIEASTVQDLSVQLGSVDISEAKVTSLWDDMTEAKIFARKNKSFEYIGYVEDITYLVIQTRNAYKGIQSAIKSITRRTDYLKTVEQNRSVRAIVRSSEQRLARLEMKSKTLTQRFL